VGQEIRTLLFRNVSLVVSYLLLTSCGSASETASGGVPLCMTDRCTEIARELNKKVKNCRDEPLCGQSKLGELKDPHKISWIIGSNGPVKNFPKDRQLISDDGSVDGLLEDITAIGEILDARPAASALRSRLQQKLNNTPNVPLKSLWISGADDAYLNYYVLLDQGGDGYQYQLLHGFSDPIEFTSWQLLIEEVADKKPELLFFEGPVGKEDPNEFPLFLTSDERWLGIPAVVSGRAFRVPVKSGAITPSQLEFVLDAITASR
jgi:ABC-type Fe3+-hydroxamate transport system substrate-binding protein